MERNWGYSGTSYTNGFLLKFNNVHLYFSKNGMWPFWNPAHKSKVRYGINILNFVIKFYKSSPMDNICSMIDQGQHHSSVTSDEVTTSLASSFRTTKFQVHTNQFTEKCCTTINDLIDLKYLFNYWIVEECFNWFD